MRRSRTLPDSRFWFRASPDNIAMWKERPRFGRLSVLAPAALSACIDASVLGAPAAGAIVATVLSELSKAFMLKKWYHGAMTKQQAEQLLMQRGRPGSYLVRESNSLPGDYVLSVRVKRRVCHVLIRREQNKYDVGNGEHFDDLVGLIEHFRAYPMTEASGDELRLMQPVSASLNLDDEQPKEPESSASADDAEYIWTPNMQRTKELEYILEKSQSFTTYVANVEEHQRKNRYCDIVPYDQTRVRLDISDAHSDYINASYIRRSSQLYRLLSYNDSAIYRSDLAPLAQMEIPRTVSDEELINFAKDNVLNNMGVILPAQDFLADKIYIAAQGCMKNTISDFWHMICTDYVRIIVTLTETDEKGAKCARFWPNLGYVDLHRGVHVQLIREFAHKHYIIRELEVRRRSRKFTVHQYHYPSWPDHKTPSDTMSVISFMCDINEHMLNLAGERSSTYTSEDIMCVHCSAGIGRTGTFIVIDMLMDLVREEGLRYGIDILEMVQLVRAQRAGMVQNTDQFVYIYGVLGDYIKLQTAKFSGNIRERFGGGTGAGDAGEFYGAGWGDGGAGRVIGGTAGGATEEEAEGATGGADGGTAEGAYGGATEGATGGVAGEAAEGGDVAFGTTKKVAFKLEPEEAEDVAFLTSQVSVTEFFKTYKANFNK